MFVCCNVVVNLFVRVVESGNFVSSSLTLNNFLCTDVFLLARGGERASGRDDFIFPPSV